MLTPLHYRVQHINVKVVEKEKPMNSLPTIKDINFNDIADVIGQTTVDGQHGHLF